MGRKASITIENLKETAKQRGGQCLSEEYKGINAYHTWKCVVGHIWEAKAKNVIYKTWCPICNRESRKDSIETMRQIAKEHNGECMTNTYTNQHEHLLWKCAEGHQWKAMPVNIKKGKWCPYCYGNVKDHEHHYKKIKEIAESKGGKVLSDKYTGFHGYLTFQCKQGHVWSALPSNFTRGTWCPKCAGIYKGGVSELNDALRKCIREWKKKSMEKYNYKCAITNTNSKDRDLEIHHSKSFHVVRDEILDELNLPIHKTICEYTSDQYELIIKKLKERHDGVVGVPLRKHIHKLFHSIYGNNTTMNDLMEFKARYLSGEFDGKNTESQQLSLII